MRLKNLSELIHNSAKHQDAIKATVEVHFEELGEDEAPIPESSLVLSRSVTKSENSTYKVNGTDKNLSEVKAILREKKIDLDKNRFLIL
jgi:structural maintenance of chromosome 4